MNYIISQILNGASFDMNKIYMNRANTNAWKKKTHRLIINTNWKNQIWQRYEYCSFFNLLLDKINKFKQTDILTKICYEWLVHIFLHNLVSFQCVFTQFSFIFLCGYKLALRKFVSNAAQRWHQLPLLGTGSS